jgi:hypothetical protein
VIDLARLILSRRKPGVRAYGSGSAKTRWILNCADIRECGQHADARHAHEKPAGGVRLHQCADRLVESNDLLAQLPPGSEHGPNNQRDVGTVEQQHFNLPIEGQSPYRAS